MKYRKYNEILLTSFFLVTLSRQKNTVSVSKSTRHIHHFLAVYTTYVNMTSGRTQRGTVVKNKIKKKKRSVCQRKQVHTNPYILNTEVTIKTSRPIQRRAPFREIRLKSFTKQQWRFGEVSSTATMRQAGGRWLC